MLSSLSCNRAKIYAKYLLAIILGLCSLWLVWDLCLKYFSGSTTILTVQEYKEYLPLPRFLLCSNQRYKKDALAAMGLPDDFFDNVTPDKSMFEGQYSFPDLNVTWQKVTWNMTNFEMDWKAYEGVAFGIRYLYFLNRITFDMHAIGYNASVRFITINTLYYGQCYLLMANKHEHLPQYGTLTGIMMNLIGNDSEAWLWILPNAGKSEKSATVNRWNYPIKHFELRNHDFLKLTFSKEIHSRQSTEGFPCSKTDEEIFYEVRLDEFNINDT